MSREFKIRCAIYTRKSSDEGLDQEFNSLDAQHEACAAYVASQRHEGWCIMSKRYDDGGVSGGTLERPGLQSLLIDIDAGHVDMVVVYKIDRLTRSLADFAQLVDRLEKSDCSFVSVTQAFNTSSSMGRLTLNVLLSFAQFEREVTAERIRDKISASKKKGLWMGGNLPLGYDRHPDRNCQRLVVNEAEAKTVRRLFNLYDQLGCLANVVRAAGAEGIRSKQRNHNRTLTGGTPLSRGQVHFLLRNPVYRGLIRHKDKIYPGQHPAIVDEPLWEKVQQMLQEASNRSRSGVSSKSRDRSWLTGKLRDETGDRLTPTHTTKGNKRLRYYVSNRLISGGPDPSGWRLPAAKLEKVIVELVREHVQTSTAKHELLADPDARRADEMRSRVENLLTAETREGERWIEEVFADGQVSSESISLTLKGTALALLLNLAPADLNAEILTVTRSFAMRRRGVEMKLISGSAAPQPDATLITMLSRAKTWARELKSGTPLAAIANRENTSGSFIRTRTQLAFLSPKIQAAIVAGTQPTDLTLMKLIRGTIPLDWYEQEQRFGFSEPAPRIP